MRRSLDLCAVLVDRIRLALTAPLAISRRRAHIGGLDDDGFKWACVRRRVWIRGSRDGKTATANIAGTETRLRAKGQLRDGHSVAVRSLATG